MSTETTLCQQLGVLWTETITMSYVTISSILKSHCRNYIMPTYCMRHMKMRTDAQNPNYNCPGNYLCLLHDKCRWSRKSLFRSLNSSACPCPCLWGLSTCPCTCTFTLPILVLKPRVLVNIPAVSCGRHSLYFVINNPTLKSHLLLTVIYSCSIL